MCSERDLDHLDQDGGFHDRLRNLDRHSGALRQHQDHGILHPDVPVAHVAERRRAGQHHGNRLCRGTDAMKIDRSIKRDQRGAAAIEAAIAMPALVVMIYGIFSVGQLFEANAGMEHALGEAARYATLCSSLSTSGSTTTCSVHTGTEV